MQEADDLIKKAQAGDVAAFEALIETHQLYVYKIALKLIGNSDDASDVAQDALVKVFLNLKKFDGKSAFTTWLYRIAVNTCYDFLRSEKRSSRVDIDDDILTSLVDNRQDMPQQVVEKSEIAKLVTRNIDLLSDEFKSVIILREMIGLSYQDIGEVLKIPLGTVKSRIKRARQSLRKAIEKDPLFSWEMIE